MKTINDIEITDEHLENKNYKFQPKLTKKLDDISSDFNQEIINEIVLWKVNRFVEIDDEIFSLLNNIKKDDEYINEDLTKEILEKLLCKKTTKGVQLAMASTILRFKNPKIYQIIDQRVYRFIYGKVMPKYYSSIDAQIETYLQYLKDLRSICNEKGIPFELSDRILYRLDKDYNKGNNIKY